MKKNVYYTINNGKKQYKTKDAALAEIKDKVGKFTIHTHTITDELTYENYGIFKDKIEIIRCILNHILDEHTYNLDISYYITKYNRDFFFGSGEFTSKACLITNIKRFIKKIKELYPLEKVKICYGETKDEVALILPYLYSSIKDSLTTPLFPNIKHLGIYCCKNGIYLTEPYLRDYSKKEIDIFNERVQNLINRINEKC